jgi:hypothetical protein
MTAHTMTAMTIELVTGPKTGSAVSETAPSNGDGTENATAEVKESIAAKKEDSKPSQKQNFWYAPTWRRLADNC